MASRNLSRILARPNGAGKRKGGAWNACNAKSMKGRHSNVDFVIYGNAKPRLDPTQKGNGCIDGASIASKKERVKVARKSCRDLASLRRSGKKHIIV